jgi:membrane protein implicated in regulation of membrane protease activity
MKKNVHPLERLVRIVVGLVLVSLAFWGPKNPWFFLGIIPMATGLMGWCLPYQLLGISTCSVQPKKG